MNYLKITPESAIQDPDTIWFYALSMILYTILNLSN